MSIPVAAAGPAVAVIVVAAGAGARLGADVPKAFVELDGRTLLEHALTAVRRAGTLAQLVVVAPQQQLPQAAAIAERVYGDDAPQLVAVVAGGAERAHSVVAGIAALLPSVRAVLVHDAARPFTPPELFDSVAAAVIKLGSGVVPALPISDTVKRVAPNGEINGTLDRTGLMAAQTPQGFPRDILEAAYRAMGDTVTSYTDEASIVSAAGHRVVTLLGSEKAFKITVPADLVRARAALRGREELRTGVGVDAHAFQDGAPLWLGGVLWPDFPAGLAGHSDGDAACHAIVDALLQAAGLGDIGAVFGTSDPRYAGASGATFIRHTMALLDREGWEVRSVSVEIIAAAPKISPRRAELEAVLSGLVGVPVTVAGTTSDGLGITGNGEGVAAVATALIAR